MEEVDVTIIGAGVVGLAIASRVARSDRNVVLVERHEGFGRETSSRNSGVIHAGIYYSAGSLKARLCVEGNGLLYGICEENGIPHKPLGKLIVAVDEEQEKGLEGLMEAGRGNGARDLRILSSREVQRLEPNVTCRAALWVPSSGIVDSHSLMRYFEATARSHDARIAYRSEVKSIEKAAGGFRVAIEDAQGEVFPFTTRVLVNSAGLESGNIAALAGIDIDEAGYRINYCKGEFFSLAASKHDMTQRLIYPFPPPGGSVGIHTVPDVEGVVRLGPYSYFVDSIDYAVDETYKELFYESVKPFLPFVELEDLEPETSGMLPKIQKPGGPARDFVIVHEEDRGLEGLIDLIGIESPGLTSSPAIGRLVAEMIEEMV